MTAVDVLAVIRFHEQKFRAEVGTPLNELAEVHAAVAELIHFVRLVSEDNTPASVMLPKADALLASVGGAA